jgi:DNA-binding response OmpR family regulator
MTGAEENLACKGKILVVDDEPDIVLVLQATLTHAGYEVLTAYDGPGALEQVEAGLPDLILLDIRMPGVDGWEVCARLKEDQRTRDILVMMVTAMGGTEAIIRGLSLGASDYLVKPFSFDELLTRVKALMQTVPSVRQEVKGRLTELLFDDNWTVLLVQVRNREHVGQIADILTAQSEARFVGRWSEAEFVLILDPEQARRVYTRLRATSLPLSLGMVSGETIGSFADAEDIIAAAHQNLLHAYTER